MKARRLASLSTAALLAAAMVGSVTTGTASATSQDDTSKRQIGAAEFAAARAQAQQERAAGRESDQTREDRAGFLRDSAREGLYYEDSEVDVVDMGGGLRVITPAAASFSEISLDDRGDTVVADATALWEAEDMAAGGQGPGMAYWQQKASGCYKLVFSGAAEMHACWYKHKLESDGDGTFDYWAYRRKGYGQPYSISGKDWSITGLAIQHYGTDTTRPKLKNIEGASPGRDFKGDCNTSPFSASVSVKAVSLSISFIDCDYYDITFGAYPGEFTNFYSQGSVFSGGNREVGYTTAVKVPQGAIPYYHDYQRLEIAKWTYPAKKCASTNSSKTCYT